MLPTLTDHLERMVALGLQAAEARRALDQIAVERRATLLEWIDTSGLSDYEVARRTGYSKQHLSLIRHGQTLPSDELYAKVFDLHRELDAEAEAAAEERTRAEA